MRKTVIGLTILVSVYILNGQNNGLSDEMSVNLPYKLSLIKLLTSKGQNNAL